MNVAKGAKHAWNNLDRGSDFGTSWSVATLAA
jgi:hypothetical protein